MVVIIVAIVSLVIPVSAIWVYWDATANKIGRDPSEKFKFFDNMSAGLWSIFTILIWIVGFTLYLMKRRALIERAQVHPVEVGGRWVKLSALGLLGALGVLGNVGDQLEKEEARSRAANLKSEAAAPAKKVVASTPAPSQPKVDAPPDSKSADAVPSTAPTNTVTPSAPIVSQQLASASATSKPNLPASAPAPAVLVATSTPSTSKQPTATTAGSSPESRAKEVVQQSEPKPPALASRTSKSSRANEDARTCLELSTNAEIIKCAEKFR